MCVKVGERHRNSLDLPLSFAVNVKLLYIIKPVKNERLGLNVH